MENKINIESQMSCRVPTQTMHFPELRNGILLFLMGSFYWSTIIAPILYKFSLTREIIPLNMINGDESFGWVKLIGIIVVWYRCSTGVVRATTLFWFHGTLPLLYLKTSSFIFSSSIYGVHPFLLLGWTTLKNQK